jgi:hypothetical protein
MKVELYKKYIPAQCCNPFEGGGHTTCSKNLRSVHPWMIEIPSLKSEYKVV